MTKEEIDTFFTENITQIQSVIESNAFKSITANDTNMLSDIYTICIRKAKKLHQSNILGFIALAASNQYRWINSNYNIVNKCIANDLTIPDTKDDQQESNHDVLLQRLEYALNKYYANAEPHEKRFFDAYVNKSVRSIRDIVKHFNVTHRGAQTLIKDFKQKVKQYEREI